MSNVFLSHSSLFLLFLLSTILPNPYLTENKWQSIHDQTINQAHDPIIIVIDPGHGGKDNGCNSHSHKEKSFTLPFAIRLGQDIQKLNEHIQVIYTRSSDISLSLNKRTEIANAVKADLFISIHANSIHDPSINGFETYVYGNSDPDQHLSAAIHADTETGYGDIADHILASMQSTNHQVESISLANCITRNLEGAVNLKNRGVKQAQFRVLKNAQMPSVLLELGYLTNPDDERVLLSKEGQKVLSKNIAKSVMQYLDAN